MRASCGLDGSAAAPALAGSCASADCASRLLGVLDDCAASIGHASGRDAAFYTALEGSALYASCAELDHAAATFAILQVRSARRTLASGEGVPILFANPGRRGPVVTVTAAAPPARQVEFRAPSRLVADRLVAEHEELAAGIATMCAGGLRVPLNPLGLFLHTSTPCM
jgi:hypothetical protein